MFIRLNRLKNSRNRYSVDLEWGLKRITKFDLMMREKKCVESRHSMTNVLHLVGKWCDAEVSLKKKTRNVCINRLKIPGLENESEGAKKKCNLMSIRFFDTASNLILFISSIVTSLAAHTRTKTRRAYHMFLNRCPTVFLIAANVMVEYTASVVLTKFCSFFPSLFQCFLRLTRSTQYKMLYYTATASTL